MKVQQLTKFGAPYLLLLKKKKETNKTQKNKVGASSLIIIEWREAPPQHPQFYAAPRLPPRLLKTPQGHPHCV